MDIDIGPQGTGLRESSIPVVDIGERERHRERDRERQRA